MPKKVKTLLEQITKNTKEIDYFSFKPQPLVQPKINVFIALVIFCFTLLIYLLTNAKTVSFWDAGEYIATSSIFGIPHPPGNPLYVVLARFFCLLSFGWIGHALVVSFLSSFFAALAVMLTYLITVDLISMWNEDRLFIIIGGYFAALLTAFSFSFWMNAVEAAVYSTMAFFINLIIWLTLLWVKKQQEFSHQNILLFIVYLFFLGFGIHQTLFQIAPAILFIIILPYIKDQVKNFSFWGKSVLYLLALFIIYIIFSATGNYFQIPVLAKFAIGISIFGIICWYLRDYIGYKPWLLASLLMILGFSTHLFLYVRSEFRPFINEGHPHTFALFMDYILRMQYGGYNFLARRASLWHQIDYHFLRYLSWQFLDAEIIAKIIHTPVALIQFFSNLIVAFLGILGFYFAFKKNKYTFWYIFSLFFMASIAMIFVLNLSNEEVRDRDYFFVTAYNFWAIVMGIGVVGVLNMMLKPLTEINKLTNNVCQRRKKISYLMVSIFFIYPIINLYSQYYKHDRTGEFIALDYGLNILNSLEENAIVFTNGDNDTFPLWYAQAVKDNNSIEHTYPAENIYPTSYTKQAIEGANQWKQSHINGIRLDVTVANLSLLNTPWYIKHLRDLEGVEIRWSDELVDNLRTQRLVTPIVVTIRSPNEEEFSVTYPESKLMTVKDFAVAKIIQDNFGKRPIYFAITCADYSGFDNFLVNEGMVQRIVAIEEPEQIYISRLENNLFNVYLYRGIFNDQLYKDENMTRLVQNYGGAHLRLVDYYQREENFERAVEVYEKAMSFVLNPEDRHRFYGAFVLAYIEANKIEEALTIIERMIDFAPDTVNPYIVGAYAMFKANENNLAFKFLEKGVEIDPYSRELAALTIQFGLEKNMRLETYQIVKKLVPYQPMLDKYLDKILDPEIQIEDF